MAIAAFLHGANCRRFFRVLLLRRLSLPLPPRNVGAASARPRRPCAARAIALTGERELQQRCRDGALCSDNIFFVLVLVASTSGQPKLHAQPLAWCVGGTLPGEHLEPVGRLAATSNAYELRVGWARDGANDGGISFYTQVSARAQVAVPPIKCHSLRCSISQPCVSLPLHAGDRVRRAAPSRACLSATKQRRARA